MLLTIHNLPPKYRNSDVKALLVEKCGLAELILDNLVLEGTTQKVTVGVADEGDAAVLVRKVNGLFVGGLQLYVEDARKKRPGSEQPFRSNKEYKLSQGSQHQPHYGQATMMPSPMQPQYADPEGYVLQNSMLNTNSLVMQSPYMNTQPVMQGYGMAAGIHMVPQDNSMVGYQADNLPYQSGGLSDVPAQQPNWAAQYPNNENWDQQGQDHQTWSNSQDRFQQNQWVRKRSRSRSPARERFRHDTRSESRREKTSNQPTWKPRQGAKKDWHGRDGNAGTGYGRPPSPQRQRFSPQRRETPLQPPENFNARDIRGNPYYLARHAPPEMLQQYEPNRNYSYKGLYQPTSPPTSNPAYFEPQDQPMPYGDHVKRSERRRSRSGDRSRSRFEGSSRSFRKRDERETWSDRKRPAPDRHEQFPKRAREHEFGAGNNRAGDRVYPVDKDKPGSKVAPGDFIPMRDRTWREQTVSQIAKANALNEAPKVVKYYKQTVSAKLDELMRDEVNVSTGEMFSRYMKLHNDKKVLIACRRRVEQELRASIEERTAEVEAALAGDNFKGAPTPKPNPKPAKPQPNGPKTEPTGPKKQPTGPKTQPAKKNSNNTAVPGRIPNYPAGDKQIFKDAKKAMQMEFAGEMTYSLDAPEDEALESDLDNLTTLIKEDCGASGEEATPADSYVAKRADAIADELRTDGETEGTQPSLATQPHPLENLAKLQLQKHNEMNPKDSLYDLPDVMPSLAREPQTSTECEPQTIVGTLEGQTTEVNVQTSDQKRKRKRNKKKRSGVPRNGGSWKEGERLPSYKRPKYLQASEGTGNVNEQGQAEQGAETQQGNQSGLDKNIREENKEIVRKDNIEAVQAEEPKQFEEELKTLELRTNIPEVDRDELVTIDEVKLEDKFCDQNDLTDGMLSQVFKLQTSEGLATQQQTLGSLTSQSQLFEYLTNHPLIFEYLATHPKVLKFQLNRPLLLDFSVSKIEQRDSKTLWVTIGNDRIVVNMLSVCRHILGQTDSDEDEYSITIDETELCEIKPFESLTNQSQSSESLTSQVSSVTSQSQPVDDLISQPQPMESLKSEQQPIESLVRVIDLTQSPSTLKDPVTQSKLSEYLENQPQLSEYLARQPQLFACLANQPQIFECILNRAQIFGYLANQPQLFECLANQPQLFEYLTSQPQLLEYLANRPYPLQYLLNRVRVWDNNTLLVTIGNERLMIPMSDQLKPKWRRIRIRKRRGAKRNRGSKTEWGRMPSYKRKLKNNKSSEEQHIKVKDEANEDTNNITEEGINEEESYLDQDGKTEISSSSQDESDDEGSSDEEVCGGNQQNQIVQSQIRDNSISQVPPENNLIERPNVSTSVLPSNQTGNQIDDNQPSLASFSQATDQLLQRLASELQNSCRSEAIGNQPQTFASQSQPFECLENQPQLSESLVSLQQPWSQIGDLVVTIYKIKNEEESNFVQDVKSEPINTGQTETNGNELEDKPKRRRKKKRGKSKNKRQAGVPRNGGTKTEWGRLPKYKRPRKTLESTEQDNKQEAQSKQSKETHQENETEVDINNREEYKDIIAVQDATNMIKQEDKQQDVSEIDEEEHNLDQDDEFDTASSSDDESDSEDDSGEDSAEYDNEGIQSNPTVPTKLSENSASQAQPENNTTERTKHNESVLPTNQQCDQTDEVLPSLASQLSEKLANQEIENPKSDEIEVQRVRAKRKRKRGKRKRKPGVRTGIPRNGGRVTEWGRMPHYKRRQPYDNRHQAQGKQTTCQENEREPGKHIGAPRNDGSKEEVLPMSSCERIEADNSKQTEGIQRTYQENERQPGKHTGAPSNDGRIAEGFRSYERKETYGITEVENKQKARGEHNSETSPKENEIAKECNLEQDLEFDSYLSSQGESDDSEEDSDTADDEESKLTVPSQLSEKLASKDKENPKSNEIEVQAGTIKLKKKKKKSRKLKPGTRTGVPRNGGHRTEWGRMPHYKRREPYDNGHQAQEKQRTYEKNEGEPGKHTGAPRNDGRKEAGGPMSSCERRVAYDNKQSEEKQTTYQENEREPEKNNGRESMNADKEVKHKVTEKLNEGILSPDPQEFSTSTTINIHRADNTDMTTEIELKQELLTTADEIKIEPSLYSLVDQVESLPSLAFEPQSFASQSDMKCETDMILATQPQPQEVTIVKVRLEEPGIP